MEAVSLSSLISGIDALDDWADLVCFVGDKLSAFELQCALVFGSFESAH